MKFLSTVSSLALFVAGALAQALQVNTPTGATSAIQCLTFQVTWTGGTGPFDLRLLDASQNLIQILTQSATASPFPWLVNQAAGTQLIFSLHDSTGGVSSSAPFTVQASSDTSCLNGGSSAAGSSTPAGSSAAGSSTSAGSSAPGSSSAPVSSSTPVSTVTTPVSTPASSTTAPATTSRASTTVPASSTRPVSSAPAASSTVPSSASARVAGGILAPLFAVLAAAAAF